MSLIALTGQPQLILRLIWLIRLIRLIGLIWPIGLIRPIGLIWPIGLIRPIGLIWPIRLIGLIGLIDNQTLKRKCMMSPSCTT